MPKFQSRKEYLRWYLSQPGNRERDRESKRRYAEKNKESIKQSREQKKDEIRESSKKTYLKYRDKIRERQKEHYLKNKEKILERNKEYRKNHSKEMKGYRLKWIKSNPEKHGESQRKYNLSIKKKLTAQIWKLNNLEKTRLIRTNYESRRRTMEKNGDKITLKLIRELMYQQNTKCYYCLEELNVYHLDHLIPLTKGGLHKEYNWVLACPSCNLRKSNKYPDEFMKLKRVS